MQPGDELRFRGPGGAPFVVTVGVAFTATYIRKQVELGEWIPETAPAELADMEREADRQAELARRTPDATDAATIREWAKSNDVKVPAKGRVPQSVVDKFNDAHE